MTIMNEEPCNEELAGWSAMYARPVSTACILVSPSTCADATSRHLCFWSSLLRTIRNMTGYRILRWVSPRKHVDISVFFLWFNILVDSQKGKGEIISKHIQVYARISIIVESTAKAKAQFSIQGALYWKLCIAMATCLSYEPLSD